MRSLIRAFAGRREVAGPSTFQRFKRNNTAVVGLWLVALLLFVAIFGPLLTSYDPRAGSLIDQLQPPSWSHPLGTDEQGRDVLSRMLYGARNSLAIGIGAIAMAVLAGGVVGALAGAAGGIVDAVLMRITDGMLAIPGIVLAIGMVALLGQGFFAVMTAVALTNAPVFARLLRSSLVALGPAEYILAARTAGLSTVRIFFRHMLPNALAPLLVSVTLALATSIITVAGLGFVGLGPADPGTPEWGVMLTESGKFLRTYPLLLFYPAFAIALTAFAFNLLGDGLREAMDPKVGD